MSRREIRSYSCFLLIFEELHPIRCATFFEEDRPLMVPCRSCSLKRCYEEVMQSVTNGVIDIQNCYDFFLFFLFMERFFCFCFQFWLVRSFVFVCCCSASSFVPITLASYSRLRVFLDSLVGLESVWRSENSDMVQWSSWLGLWTEHDWLGWCPCVPVKPACERISAQPQNSIRYPLWQVH